MAIGHRPHGRLGHGEVHGGDVEPLVTDHRTGPVPGHQAHHRGQVGAGGLAADADAAGIDAQLVGVVDQPEQGGVAVLGWRGVGVLRGEAVVDRGHRAVGARGDHPTARIALVERADAPAAPVQEHVERGRSAAVGQVQPDRDLAALHGNREVPLRGRLRALRHHQEPAPPGDGRRGLPALRHRRRLWAAIEGVHELHDLGDSWFERHAVRSRRRRWAGVRCASLPRMSRTSPQRPERAGGPVRCGGRSGSRRRSRTP